MTLAVKPPVGLLALLSALVLASLASLALGSLSVPLHDVWGAFTDYDNSDAETIVREVRGPRTLVGIAVGGALGAAGALMQGMTRNPLADPGILGIVQGASFAVVLAIFLLGISSALGFVWFGFAGALVASVVVYVLGGAAQRSARATPLNLAIAGAAVAALFGALTSAIIVVDSNTLEEFRYWVVGSIAGRDLTTLGIAVPFLLVGFVIAMASGPALNALALGEDMAQALGQRMARTRAAIVTAFVLLAGGAVAVAGPISFIGLIVPHVARAAVGNDYRWVIPYAAVLGAILVVGADVAGRLIARPQEVQVGILTAVIGVPVFIALVRRRKLGAL